MSENEKKTLDLSINMPTEQEPLADIWGDDALGREKFAGDLTRIVKNAAEHKSFTLSLHGDWGTGKTYLLQRWHKQLQKEEWRAVYFNAWEDDFQADSLTAIVGQLWKEIKEGDFAEIGKSLKSLVGNLGEKALGVVGGKKKDLQSTAEQTVDDYLAVRGKLDDFKVRLKKLAKAVKNKTGFPLVFIVDELDRCRPTFAIEVLERIKHLFDVPNIAFVFGVNKTELKKSIRSVYGCINAEDYLRRFFDIGLTLPSANLSVYCKHLLKSNDLANALNHLGEKRGGWTKATSEFSDHLIGHTEMSLRQLEHVVRLLRYAINARIASGETLTAEAWSIFVLALLKVKNPDLYAKFIGGKCRCAEVIDYILAPLPEPMGDAEKAAQVVESAIYCLAKGDERINILKGLQHWDSNGNINSLDAFVSGFLAERTKEPNRHLNCWEMIADIEEVLRNPDMRKAAAALLDLTDDSRQ